MRFHSKSGLLLGTMLAALATSPALAAEAADDQTGGEAILVEATKIAQDLRFTTQPVVVIGEQQIEAEAQTDLTEILRMQPSFDFKQAGGPGQFSYPRLRSFSDALLYVIDGVKINEGRSGGVNNLVGQIDPSAIQRIEILRGPQATLYGADSTGGVVSISTKSGGPTEGIFRAEAGSLDWKKATATLRTETGLGDGVLGFALNGTIIDSGGVHEYEFYDNRTLSGRVSYQGARAEVGASLFYVDAAFGSAELDEAYCCATPENYWYFQTPDPNSRNDTKALLGSVWASHEITDNLRHKLLLGYYERDSNRFDANDGLLGHQSAPFDGFNFDGVTYGRGDPVPIYDGSSVETYSTGKNYQITYDLVYSASQFDLLGGIEYWEQSYVSSGTYGASDQTQDVWSFYGQLRVPLLDDRLHLQAGLRHDKYNAWGGHTTYSAGASYEVADGISLYGNYGTSFTQPTLAHLFDPTNGDPSLTPATGETIEGGVRVAALDNRLNGSVTLYHTDVDNVIAYDYAIPNPRTASGFGQYANRDGKRVKGVEVDVSYLLTDDLTVRGVYSYIDAEQAVASGDWARVVQTPYHSGNIALSYNTDRFDLGASVYYTGARLRWAGDLETDAYARVDLSARYFVTQGFAVYTRIENLLDSNIIEEIGYEQPGLYAIAGVQFGF